LIISELKDKKIALPLYCSYTATTIKTVQYVSLLCSTGAEYFSRKIKMDKVIDLTGEDSGGEKSDTFDCSSDDDLKPANINADSNNIDYVRHYNLTGMYVRIIHTTYTIITLSTIIHYTYNNV
jgi:hypothetical protein